MTENHIVAFANGSFPYGVDIRGAGSKCQRTDNGVHRAAVRACFFNPADIPDAQHGKTFHADILLSYDLV